MINYLRIMKTDIHPKYNEKAKVTCACGSTFEVGSTADYINVEICSNCHPFYTGKQKLVDTAKRVDRFQARAQKASAPGTARKGKKAKQATRKAKKAAKTAKAQA